VKMVPMPENEINRQRFVTRRDKKGEPFIIGRGGPDDYERLLDMYSGFSPRPAAQGLPPSDPEKCSKWVGEILKTGKNFLALREARAIGHAALIPDPWEDACEYLIFVHQSSRNRGIGTALTDLAVREAREKGCRSIWLCVETKNVNAIKLYEKFGFIFCDMDACERKMALDLMRL